MSQTFGYDNIDRLTSAIAGSYGSLTYLYNAHGNRQTAGGVTYTYDPNPTLRLLSQDGSTSAMTLQATPPLRVATASRTRLITS